MCAGGNAAYYRSDCEKACTSHTPCIAYFYSDSSCYLVTSMKACPMSYTLYENTLSTTSSDLGANSNSAYVCYSKDEGNHMIFMHILIVIQTMICLQKV